MFVAPSNAFADTCYDDITGDMWYRTLFTGPPVDAGIVNVTPTNDDADADTANDDNLANLIAQIDAVINTIVPFLVGLAVFLVIWESSATFPIPRRKRSVRRRGSLSFGASFSFSVCFLSGDS